MTITLLAIDDSKTMRKVVEITFAGEDFRTVLADGSADGLAKVQSERPSIALVDATLAGASGYDVCQQIKQQAPATAVIIMSSKQQPYDRNRGTQVGADDFIDKPFDTQQLIDKVIVLARRGSDVAAAPARPPVQVASSPAPVRAPAPTADAGQRARVQTLSFGASNEDILSASPAAVPPPAFQASPVARSPSPVVAPTPAARTAASAPAAPSSARSGVDSAAGGRAIAERPTVDRSMADRPAADRAVADRAVADRAVADRAVADRAVADRAVADRPAADNGAGGQFADKLAGLGLTSEQVQAVLALSREVVEQVVWEVVPTLAEAMIQEEIRRLTSD